MKGLIVNLVVALLLLLAGPLFMALCGVVLVLLIWSLLIRLFGH